MIEGEVLTISIEASLGTRGNFNIVLPVKVRGGFTFPARLQGRPQTASCLALARWRSEQHRWSTSGSKITSPENLEAIRDAIENRDVIIVEHWFFCGASAPDRMVFDDFDDFVDYIQNKSDINKILVRIGTNVAELKVSRSHTIAD